MENKDKVLESNTPASQDDGAIQETTTNNQASVIATETPQIEESFEEFTDETSKLLDDVYNVNRGIETPVEEAAEEAPVTEETEVKEDVSEEVTEDKTDAVNETDAEEAKEDDKTEDTSDAEVESLKINMEDISETDLLTFGDKEYTKKAITAMLGRVASASNKSREANAATEKLDSQKTDLANQIKEFESRKVIAQVHPKLNELSANITALNNELSVARDNQDSIEIPLIKDKLDLAHDEARKLSGTLRAEQDKATQKHIEAQTNRLTELGLGDILSDETKKKTLGSYITSNASEPAKYALDNDATLVVMAHKAMLWDKSQTKGFKSLKKSKVALKSGGKTITSSVKPEVKSDFTTEFGQGGLNKDDSSYLDDYFSKTR